MKKISMIFVLVCTSIVTVADFQRYKPIQGGFEIQNGNATFSHALYGWHDNEDVMGRYVLGRAEYDVSGKGYVKMVCSVFICC